MGWNYRDEIREVAFKLAEGSRDPVVRERTNKAMQAILDLYQASKEEIFEEAFKKGLDEVKVNWQNKPWFKIRMDKLARNKKLVEQGLAVVLPDGSIE